MHFNSRGLLTPETIIKISVKEFEHQFSIKLGGGSRRNLFENYRLFCTDLKSLLGVNTLTQWIDGSYVTLANDPEDIDLVTFIDADLTKSYEKELKKIHLSDK